MPTINIRWAANTDELRRNLRSSLGDIEATKQAAEKMVQSLSGQKLITAAHNFAAGVREIGGAQRLTSNELERGTALIQRAIDKYRALGQEAPAALLQVNRALRQQQALLASIEHQRAGAGGGLSRDFLGSLGVGFGASAGAAAGGALALMVRQVADLADSLSKLSDSTGISVVGLQRLDAIAKPSGNSIDQLANAVNRFQRNLAEGDKEAGQALARIGLSFEQLQMMNPDEQFIAIARAIQDIKSPAEQVAIAMALFGRVGAEILPSLKADVDALADSTFKMSERSVKAWDDLGDAVQRTKTSTLGAIGEVLSALGGGVLSQIGVGNRNLGFFGGVGSLIEWLGTQRPPERPPTAPAPVASAQRGDIRLESTRSVPTAAEMAAIERASAIVLRNAEAALHALTPLGQAERQLFSADLIARAQTFAQALGDTSNIAKLTLEQQTALSKIVTQAIAAFDAMGQQAPEALQRIKRELDAVLFAATAVRKLNDPDIGLIPQIVTDEDAARLRNVAMGFQENGDLITITMEELQAKALETKAVLESFLMLPNVQGSGFVQQVRADIEEARLATNNWGTALDLIINNLGLLGQAATDGTRRFLRGVQILIGAVRDLIVQLNAAAAAATFLDVLRGVGFGITVASAFISTGGRVTPSGVQHFAAGGVAKPRSLFGDSVPAMLTPGEMILNANQQRAVGALLAAGGASGQGGGSVVHTHHWDLRGAVITNENDLRRLARKLGPYHIRDIAENKDQMGSRSRAAHGMPV